VVGVLVRVGVEEGLVVGVGVDEGLLVGVGEGLVVGVGEGLVVGVKEGTVVAVAGGLVGVAVTALAPQESLLTSSKHLTVPEKSRSQKQFLRPLQPTKAPL